MLAINKITNISYIDLKQVDDYFIPHSINMNEKDIDELNSYVPNEQLSDSNLTNFLNQIANKLSLKQFFNTYEINIISIKYEESKKKNEYITHIIVQYLSSNYEETLDGIEVYIEFVSKGYLALFNSEMFKCSSTSIIDNIIEYKLFNFNIPNLFKQLKIDTSKDVEISIFSLDFPWGKDLITFPEEMLNIFNNFNSDDLSNILNQFINDVEHDIEYLAKTKKSYRCTILLTTIDDESYDHIDETEILDLLSENKRDDFDKKTDIPTYYISDYCTDKKIILVFTPALNLDEFD